VIWLRALAILSALGDPAPSQPPVRLLLSVGSNIGSPSDRPLEFAEDDAARIREVFVELGGLDSDHALLLAHPTADEIRERIAEIKGRISELHALGRQGELIVFVSAHGAEGELHLVGTELSIEELRELVRGTEADLKIVIVDACDTGVESKGASKGNAYALTVEPSAVKGEIFVASSGAHEASQEWNALGGSLFTHHLLAALRGDADFDHDGRITLMEAFGYAQRRTVVESVDVGQHPEFDIGLTGSSDVVLTELRRGRAHVTFSRDLEGRFVLASLPRPEILLEVQKTRGEPLTVALPAGNYVLRQPQGFRVALQQIQLPYGGTAQVDGKQFVVRDFAEVALKGSGLEFHPNALQLSGALTAPPIEGTPALLQLGATYRLALGQLWGAVGFQTGHTNFPAVDLSTDQWRFASRLSGGIRFWTGPIIWMPGASVELSVLRQTDTRGAEPIIDRSYPSLPQRDVLGFATGPTLWAEAPIAGPVFASADLTLWFRDLSAESQSRWTVAPELTFALGVRF
jgi:hypothetical protein